MRFSSSRVRFRSRISLERKIVFVEDSEFFSIKRVH